MPADGRIDGELSLFFAFDWGDEIHLENARKLISAFFPKELPRRRRTPSSFTFRPAPLYIDLKPLPVTLTALGPVQALAGLTLFDFGAVSLALRIPFCLSPTDLLQLAGSLADPGPLAKIALEPLHPLFQRLLPTIQDANWQPDLREEYFVFHLDPAHLPFARDSNWLAGLVRLETAPLSPDEVQEALRLKIAYSPDDLFIADWTSAVLFDRECEETLQAIEFANLQLLEYRHIDLRLDAVRAAAGSLIHHVTRSRLPLWRPHARPLRLLGEMKMEANDLFERTGNALKLVGDPYLARVYRLVAARFYLETWEHTIQRKLEVAESAYEILAEQAGSLRLEVLEMIVILLILIEIIMAFFH